MIMLDTNVCSYIIKGEDPWLTKFVSGDTKEFAISAIVAYELELWRQRQDSVGSLAQLIAAFLRQIRVLPFDSHAASVSGKVVSNLMDHGRSIGAFDPLIAAHAISERAVLVTNNASDFKLVDGLKVASSL